jgi:hypothetical protein
MASSVSASAAANESASDEKGALSSEKSVSPQTISNLSGDTTFLDVIFRFPIT